MTDTKLPLAILTVGLLLSLISTVYSSSDLNFSLDHLTAGSVCEGTIEECVVGYDDELDSEEHRRMLAQTSYISYGALNRNRVPCSRRGASYYNCRPGAQANPYRRGCSYISRCRRS
ncbi:hypothetical protein RND81_04G206800 [Saponaria officinalis]|uniref:Uncharacterized protein n=1 Tax=Saponaria officinalis TaxID=3572 RepID=A0AAW1LMZ9_SAPOF